MLEIFINEIKMCMGMSNLRLSHLFQISGEVENGLTGKNNVFAKCLFTIRAEYTRDFNLLAPELFF